ncbi:hypothetical protein [Candidatus Leptofilum sp.]|uniref:hypothetical protein n=1 Tax=Candidatus Leptofilum sp. TaxID=3241576 RepID=UPI003B58EA3A
MGEPEHKQRDTAVHGDVVGGDKLTVGDIENAKGVAIGQGASVTINEMAKKYWYLLILSLVLVIVVILALPTINEILPERRPSLQVEQEIKELPIGSELQDVSVNENMTFLATRQGIVWLNSETGGSDRILSDYWVTAVAANSNNNEHIWFGTDEGLVGIYDLDADIFQEVEHPLLQNWITAIHEDQYGAVWIADSENGLLKISNDATPEEFPLPGEQTPIRELVVFTTSTGDALIALTRREINIWYDNEWQTPLNVPGTGFANSITSDGKNTVWFTKNDEVIRLRIPENFNRNEIEYSLTACKPIENNISTGMAIDIEYGSGFVWLVSQGGLARSQANNSEVNDCGVWVSADGDTLPAWDELRAAEIGVFWGSGCNPILWVVEQSELRYRKLRLLEC